MALAQKTFLESNPDRSIRTLYASSSYRKVVNVEHTTNQTKEWPTVQEDLDLPDTASLTALDGASLRNKIGGRTLAWALNWALVHLDPKRPLSPSTRDNIISKDINIAEGASIDFFCKVAPDRAYQVAKFGRTTGWTTGQINAIPSILRLRTDLKYGMPTEPRQYSDEVVLAIGILPNSKNQNFIEPGDSGSAVLLNEKGYEASVMGLGFGSNRASGLTYMCPMSLVVRDIEEITGAEVVEPAEWTSPS